MMSVARPLVINRRRVEEHLLNLPMLAGFVLALVSLLSLLYLSQTSSVAITGYDVQELAAQKELWQLRNDQLRLQIAEAQSVDRIEREARLRLGMGPPERVVFVRQPATQKRPASPRPDDDLDRALTLVQNGLRSTLSWLGGTL